MPVVKWRGGVPGGARGNPRAGLVVAALVAAFVLAHLRWTPARSMPGAGCVNFSGYLDQSETYWKLCIPKQSDAPIATLVVQDHGEILGSAFHRSVAVPRRKAGMTSTPCHCNSCCVRTRYSGSRSLCRRALAGTFYFVDGPSELVRALRLGVSSVESVGAVTPGEMFGLWVAAVAAGRCPAANLSIFHVDKHDDMSPPDHQPGRDYAKLVDTHTAPGRAPQLLCTRAEKLALPPSAIRNKKRLPPTLRAHFFCVGTPARGSISVAVQNRNDTKKISMAPAHPPNFTGGGLNCVGPSTFQPSRDPSTGWRCPFHSAILY